MNDSDIMSIAIEQAKIGLSKSNFPVGAVLLINKQIIDRSYNQNKEAGTLYLHAENALLVKHSALLKEAARNNWNIEIYCTLEPCLYCFGGILQHNVNRLVYSASDPVVGACALLRNLREWYLRKNIIVEKGILLEEYLPILYEYNKKIKNMTGKNYLRQIKITFNVNDI